MVNPAEAVEEAKGNKRVALLIAALALALALTEVAGDDAKTEAQIKKRACKIVGGDHAAFAVAL
jgi:hypothetical protein